MSLFYRDGLVSFGPRGERTAADLWAASHRIAQVLPANERGRSVLLVFEADRFAFTASLLATWSRGLVALVPPDNRRATLTKLQGRADVTAILHDTESGLEFKVQDILREPGELPDLDAHLEVLEARWRDDDTPLLRMFAAVARGAPEEFTISGPDLQRELERLRERPLPETARVAGAVPIGHRFGLVHTVLRPLAEGGAFFGSLGPTSLLTDALPAHPASVLVGHPRELPALARAAGRCQAVWSSGAALSPAIADAVTAASGVRPLDLFTLSVAGALAIRSEVDASWRPLSSVAVRSTGKGGAFELEGRVHATADDVRVHDDGRFVLSGRHDRRLSTADGDVDLDAVEVRLAASAGVADAAAIRAGSTVLVALTPDGAVSLPESSETLLAAVEELRNLDCEIKVMPGLPRDGMGRLTRGRLLALFARGPDGDPRSARLDFEPADEEGVFEVVIPKNYRWFDGHFDQYPIMPAAVQLKELVVPCVRSAGLLSGEVRRFERLKFSQRIVPGMRVRVRVRPGKKSGVEFELHSGEKLLSAGRLVGHEAEAP